VGGHQQPAAGQPARYAVRRRPDGGDREHPDRDALGHGCHSSRQHQRQSGRSGAGVERPGRDAPGSPVHPADPQERRRLARRSGNHLTINEQTIMSFVRYIPRPADSPRAAFDTSALSRLQGEVARSGGSDEEKKEVARQFEALFLQQLIKQARQASTGIQGLFQSDQTRLAQSMSDEQTALQLADRGVGLAQALLDQMQGGAGRNRASGSGAESRPPELSGSRLPALRSRIGTERPDDAPSISALIDMLSNSVAGRA